MSQLGTLAQLVWGHSEGQLLQHQLVKLTGSRKSHVQRTQVARPKTLKNFEQRTQEKQVRGSEFCCPFHVICRPEERQECTDESNGGEGVKSTRNQDRFYVNKINLSDN